MTWPDWQHRRNEHGQPRPASHWAPGDKAVLHLGPVKGCPECAPETEACPQGHDRSAGRWCAECRQHGSHHTDTHAEFACCDLAETEVAP